MKHVYALISCLAFFPALLSQDDLQSLKILSAKDRPIVQGFLNGKVAFFLLDTGASLSIFHEGSKKRYKFGQFSSRNGGSRTIIGISGKETEISQASNFRLYLGEVPIKRPIFVYDMGRVIQQIRSQTSYTISGIIGSDIMRKYGFIIDLAKREIMIPKVGIKKPQSDLIITVYP